MAAAARSTSLTSDNPPVGRHGRLRSAWQSLMDLVRPSEHVRSPASSSTGFSSSSGLGPPDRTAHRDDGAWKRCAGASRRCPLKMPSHALSGIARMGGAKLAAVGTAFGRHTQPTVANVTSAADMRTAPTAPPRVRRLLCRCPSLSGGGSRISPSARAAAASFSATNSSNRRPSRQARSASACCASRSAGVSAERVRGGAAGAGAGGFAARAAFAGAVLLRTRPATAWGCGCDCGCCCG